MDAAERVGVVFSLADGTAQALETLSQEQSLFRFSRLLPKIGATTLCYQRLTPDQLEETLSGKRCTD